MKNRLRQLSGGQVDGCCRRRRDRCGGAERQRRATATFQKDEGANWDAMKTRRAAETRTDTVGVVVRERAQMGRRGQIGDGQIEAGAMGK